MGKEYEISKASGLCVACSKQMQPTEEFMGTVRETDEGFAREDYCIPCWEGRKGESPEGVFAIWRSEIPRPTEKKKLFVDDDLLINFFERLSDAEEPTKINFRFVLALVLMRKKILIYDRMEKADGKETWQMHFKGKTEVQKVTDPHMDDEKSAEVSKSLGEILPNSASEVAIA